MISLNVIREPDEFCQPCGLFKLCQSPVMNGEGSESPDILFVGEAPGGDEDKQGIPWCGEAGSELRQAVEDVGIDIKKCRFTNAVRCRPPNNDIKKYPDAVTHCKPHILREIRATAPKVVVLLGNTAIKSLLNRQGILRLHNQVIDIGRLKFVCMFHPAYLLRNDTPDTRRKFLDALRTVKFLVNPKTAKLTKKRNHTVIMDRVMLKEHVDMLKKQPYVATDIEANTLSPFAVYREPKIAVVGFAWSKDNACAFPLEVRTGLKGCKVSHAEVAEGVREVYHCRDIRFLTWHGKYDFGYPKVKYNIWMGGKLAPLTCYFDGMLASYALDERSGIHGLKDWASRAGMPNYDLPLRQYTLLNKGANHEEGGDITLVPADILYPYNMDDCLCTFRCFLLQRKLLKEQGLWKMPFKFPLRQISWIAGMMEINGLGVSLTRNRELDQIFTERMRELDARLRKYKEIRILQKRVDEKLMGEIYLRVKHYKRKVPSVKRKVLELFANKVEHINLNSPEVKRALLFDVLDYESLAETSTKLPSTERWILEELFKKYRHPAVGDLIRMGTYTSADSKYIAPIPGWIGSDGRVHSTMMPHGTRTGRLSSRDPNLYNLPARGKLTEELMSQFIPRGADYVGVKHDSKQIELREMADRAKDKVMIKEFNDGKDPHAMGAQAAYEYTEKEWAKLPKDTQKDLRGNAKNAVSFGLIYGRDAPALALDFGWSIKKGEEFKRRYFEKYNGIAAYLEAERERLLKHGESISHYNRHRRLDAQVHSEDIGKSNHAIRELINSPIQGDASDINIIAAYRMERWLRKHGMKTRVILYVYDAVWLDAHKRELEIVISKLHEFMTDRDFIQAMTGWKLSVPLDTDCSLYEKNFGHGTELEHTNIPGQFVIPKHFLR
jgi:uracil-DNA glycosylase family 4